MTQERIEETAQRLHPAVGWVRHEPKGRQLGGPPAPAGLRCRHELADGRVVTAGINDVVGQQWSGWVSWGIGDGLHVETDTHTPADFRAVLAACSGAVLAAMENQ